MSFYRRNDALDYYKNNKIRAPCLFAEDKDDHGRKRFHVTKARNIYDSMIKSNKNHYYEFWAADQPLVFGIDLDIVKADETDARKIVETTIRNVMSGAKKYYDYEYVVKDIIVLENMPVVQSKENPNKLSFHIIFRGLTFESHLVCKDFFSRLKKDYKMEHCDDHIYNNACFRLCFCSKMGKDAIALPTQFTIDGLDTCFPVAGDKTKGYKFWLKTMLTYVKDDDRVISKKEMVPKRVMNRTDTPKNDASNINLLEIMFKLPPQYYEDYDTWIKMGMILKNTGDFFELWNTWSKQSSKYKAGEMEKLWDGFKADGHLTIATLIHWCNQHGITNIFKNKMNIKETVLSYPETPIEIDITNALVINQPKLEPEVYYPYMDKRMVAVQSEKGTGKTSNLLKVLFESGKIQKDTSVLFVSSRRTFAMKLMGDLKGENFKLYSDIKSQYITSKRIICQIDSLMRLDRPSYDYVVIDECESLARYLTSSHFTKSPHANLVVGMLKMRLREAKYVYIMDADLSVRCMNFYKNILRVADDDYQLIVNEYKPYQDYTFVCMSYESWLVRFMHMVEKNKRIVVPMASNAKAKDLYNKLRQDYPGKNILLIHKETSDDDKLEKLMNVNTIWNKYDIIIYTPSVCMGVSFDIHGHFDEIFAYGCHMSLGAQEFCQMIHRVRHPKSKKIHIAMDYYKELNKEDDVLRIEEVEEMMCSDYYLTHYDIHNNMIHKEPTHIVHNGTDGYFRREVILTYPYKREPEYDLYVRNSKEIIENKLNFSACFFGYAKHKGYNIEFAYEDSNKELMDEMKGIREKRVDEQREKTRKGITEAKDISQEEYFQKIKTRQEYLTEQDIFEIQRFSLKKCYGIEEQQINDTFVDTYNDRSKMKWYRNLSTVMSTENLSTWEKLDTLKRVRLNNMALTNCYLDFTIKNQYGYHFYALQVLKFTKVDINKLDIEVEEEVVQAGIEEFMDWAEPYKKDIALKYDVNIRNKVLVELNKMSRMKLVNNIIENMYGLKFRKNKSKYQIVGYDVWNDMPREQKIIPQEMEGIDEMTVVDMFEDNEGFDFQALDEGIDN